MCLRAKPENTLIVSCLIEAFAAELPTPLDVGEFLGRFHEYCLYRADVLALKQQLREVHGNYVDGLWFEITRCDPRLHFDDGQVQRSIRTAPTGTQISLTGALAAHFEHQYLSRFELEVESCDGHRELVT